jgi:hypothetical protein
VNRRDVLAAFGVSVSAILPIIEPEREFTDEEITALERITAKIEGDRVDEMFETKITGGDKSSITVTLKWTDPDMLLLRDHGLMG